MKNSLQIFHNYYLIFSSYIYQILKEIHIKSANMQMISVTVDNFNLWFLLAEYINAKSYP